jgi:hypothetical protein
LVDLFDNTFVIAGLIVSIAAAFGVPLIYALTRTRDITLRGDFRLTANEKQLQDIKDDQTKGFQNLKDMFQEYENKTNEWKNQMLDKLGKMSLVEERLTWRLDAVEDELKEIRDKKLAALEKELRDVASAARRNGGGKGAV